MRNIYIPDNEVLAFSAAYSKIILRGLGSSYHHQATSLGQFMLAQRVGYNGPMKFRTLKKLLILALTQLIKNTHHQKISSELITWEQIILTAESSVEVGICCVQLESVLFAVNSKGE